jgi:tetratricopeptide (TPR) repeat protein
MWYRKGRYAWNLHTRAGTQRSIEYFQNAVKEDPGYALSYAGLAMAYAVLPSFSQRPEEEERVKARIASAEGLRLDDHLADTHNAAGIVYMVVDRNFRQAAKEFRKAMALDPRSVLAHDELSICLVSVGRTEEAVEQAQLSKALDPLSTRATLGLVLFYGRRYMEAATEFEEILKLDPYSYRAHINLGRTYLSLGKFEEARRAFEEASRLSSDPVAEGLMAQAEAMEGDTAGAVTILAALEKRARTNYVAPISLAFALAGLGRMDDALVYLKQASTDRTLAALYLNVEPSWDALHNNPEFRNLVSDITLAGTE